MNGFPPFNLFEVIFRILAGSINIQEALNYKEAFPITSAITLNSLLTLAKGYDVALIVNNEFNLPGGDSFIYRAALGRKEYVASTDKKVISDFLSRANQDDTTVYGHVAYGYKDHIEKLTSRKNDEFEWPLVHFFIPRAEIIVNGDSVIIGSDEQAGSRNIYEMLCSNQQTAGTGLNDDINLIPMLSTKEYARKHKMIQDKISRGDVYELNFCMELKASGCTIDPYSKYLLLSEKFPAPFSAFYCLQHNYLLCSSPERFIRKKGATIISQPVKGTAARGKNENDDRRIRDILFNNPKERSENVMIVDLVRNDLSRVAKRGSVKVDELFGIYSFPAVHQMISTVSAEVKDDVKFTDILHALFPMGSMTGAPKVSAMKIIDELEDFNRGIYSGCVGYITPEGDFDFNVVIRSIIYNSLKQLVSVRAGSAITSESEADYEYNECLLKAEALISIITHKTFAG